MNLIDDKELERQFDKFYKLIIGDLNKEIEKLNAKIEQLQISPTSKPITTLPTPPPSPELKPIKEETKTEPPKKTEEDIKKEKEAQEKKELEEKQKKEAEAKKKLEEEQKEKERLEKEKKNKEKAEQENKELEAKNKAEAERKEKERLQTEKADKEKKEKERIIELWKPFFIKHDISNEDNKKIWQEKFIEDTAGAKKLYTDALEKDSKGKPRKSQLTEEQKKIILGAKTPEEIKVKQKEVKDIRTKKKWSDFFHSHNITTPEEKKEWKTKYKDKEAKEAEQSYEKALNGKVENVELNDEEKELVKKATTPTKLEHVLKTDIAELRKKRAEEKKKAEELKKYDELLKEINDPTKTTFNSLPETYKEAEIKALHNDLLPTDKKKETLTAKIKERRETFHYSLNKTEDGGLTPEDLKKALEKIKKDHVWEVQEKKPITVEIFNELFNLKPTTPDKIESITDYFKRKGGYKVSDEIEKKEKEFTGENEWKKGHYKLTDYYEKAGFSPEKPEEYFCEQPIEPTKGILPFPTSAGKTTAVPACIFGYSREQEKKENDPKKGWNIIIVSPTPALAQDAYNHHTDWLWKDKNGNNWRCAYHLRDHGGEYKVAKNDLTYYDSSIWNESEKQFKRSYGHGEKGISIMEPWALLVYLVRNIIKVRKIKCDNPKEKERIEKGKLTIKEKLINKERTIIYFDESHFAKNGSTTYSKIQELTQILGYNTMRATATFKGKPFSISMPHKIERKYMSGLVPKYTDKQGKEVDLNKWLAKGKCLVFLPKAELTEKQQGILKKHNVGYVVLDDTTEPFATGLTDNCPNGYAFFGDVRYGIGFTFSINTCISLMELELKKLNRSWNYDSSIEPLTDADLTQESGRVSRKWEGKFYAVSKKTPQDPNFTKNFDATNDLASLMVEVVLSKDVESEPFQKLAKIYPSLTGKKTADEDTRNLELLQSAIALPFEDGKGRMPEEILIGLTKGNPNYPQFDTKKMPDSADKDLWARFKGNYKPKEIDKEQAKELLFIMVGNSISNLKTFPKTIKWQLENPLIKTVGFIAKDEKATEQSKEYEKNILEIKKIVMGVVAKQIKDPNKVQYNDETEFKKVVNLLKLPLHEDKLKIEIIQEFMSKLKNPKNPTEGFVPKSNLTLKISYN